MGPKKQKRSRLMPRQVVGGGADEVETATVAALLPRQDQETVAAFFPRATKSTKPWGRRRLFPRQAEATAEAGPLSTPLVETVPEGNPMSEDLVY